MVSHYQAIRARCAPSQLIIVSFARSNDGFVDGRGTQQQLLTAASSAALRNDKQKDGPRQGKNQRQQLQGRTKGKRRHGQE
jgi:hypothetical protein